MVQVGGAVDDRDADFGIAAGHAVLQALEPGDVGDGVHLAPPWMKVAAGGVWRSRLSAGRKNGGACKFRDATIESV